MKATILAVFLLTGACCLADGEWECITLCEPQGSEQRGSYNSLVLDDEGYPHIVYSNRTAEKAVLYYSFWEGRKWVTEVIDEYDGEEYASFKSISLKYDNNGILTVSYFLIQGNIGELDELRYARFENNSWEVTTVASYLRSIGESSLAYDSNNTPYILHRVDLTQDILLAHRIYGHWHIEHVDSSEGGTKASLVIDSNDELHTCYDKDYGYNYITHAHNDQPYGSWDTKIVDDSRPTMDNVMCIDSDNGLHIAYEAYGANELRYAYKHPLSSTWYLEKIDGGEAWDYHVSNISITSDQSDVPHVSCHAVDDTLSKYCLTYAVREHEEWIVTEICDSSVHNNDTCIAVDSFGHPHILFSYDPSQEFQNAGLHYAWWNLAPPSFELVSPVDGADLADYPLCDWEDAPDYPQVTYDLLYAKNPYFFSHSEINGITDSSYQFTAMDDLEPGKTYYWKVKATDGYLETWSKQVWSFTTPIDLDITEVQLATECVGDGILLDWVVDGDAPASLTVLRGAIDPVAVSGAMPGETTRWLDRNVTPGVSYVYWLETVDVGGYTKVFGPTDPAIVPGAVHQLALEVPYPNPANNSVAIVFELPAAQSVSLSVYDLAGRRVETLSEGELAAGRHEVVWDCAGESAGVYLLRLETEERALSRRISLLR